jgi:hypothetical protein
MTRALAKRCAASSMRQWLRPIPEKLLAAAKRQLALAHNVELIIPTPRISCVLKGYGARLSHIIASLIAKDVRS